VVAGQHHIGGLIEQCAEPPVAAFGDATCIVDLTGLITTRDEAQIGAHIAGTSEAIGIVDRGYMVAPISRYVGSRLERAA
jgi:hypothetical protein